jgi:hypothetical protein
MSFTAPLIRYAIGALTVRIAIFEGFSRYGKGPDGYQSRQAGNWRGVSASIPQLVGLFGRKNVTLQLARCMVGRAGETGQARRRRRRKRAKPHE